MSKKFLSGFWMVAGLTIIIIGLIVLKAASPGWSTDSGLNITSGLAIGIMVLGGIIFLLSGTIFIITRRKTKGETNWEQGITEDAKEELEITRELKIGAYKVKKKKPNNKEDK